MIALLDFIPSNCPNCGKPLKFGRHGTADYFAGAGHTCDGCEMGFRYIKSGAHDALLTACKAALINEGQDACCLPILDHCGCWRCKARAAIAKATA